MINSNTKVYILSFCLMASSISHAALNNTLMNNTSTNNESIKHLKLTAEQHLAMGLQTALAIKSDLIPSSVYPAQANIPLKTIRSLSSPLSGKVTKLNYVHGPIKKNQVFAEIESPDLLKIQESFLTTISDLKIAQQTLKRAQQLNQSGISSTKKLQQSISDVKKINLNKAQIKKSLELVGMASDSIQLLEKSQQLQAPILQITSPIDGQLFDLNIRLGERVDKNKGLISLGEINPIILLVHVPVEMANSIEEGQKADIIAMHKQGIVEHIDAMVDPMTQSVDIHISVDNKDQKLRTGQLFNIRFLTTEKEPVYQISSNAVIKYADKTVLFVKQDDTIQVIPIKVINITNQSLYFSPKIPFSSPLNIYIKGTTAIKSALDAFTSTE
ncbi:MAG: efflux RND transporter periplasmic adaptor subunit [Pseudomonadota bacterium]